jgi:thimet oligopeptidase
MDAGGYGPFLMHCHPDKDVRDAGAAAQEALDKWSSDLVFRREIFDAVSHVDEDRLDGLPARSLGEWQRDLRRAGHELPKDARDELQRLRTRLIELEVGFSKNIAEFTDGIEIALDDTDGLPTSFIESLSEGTAPGTVRVSLDYPEYQPFMQQAANRESRRALQYRFYNQAVAVNRPLLEEAIGVRSNIADLLGFDTWADHQMELKMADLERVEALYDSVVPGLTKKATEEKAELQALLELDEPGAVLSAWDWAYYDTQQARTDFGVDQNEVAEYFPLEDAVAGMFDITGTVLGIRYEEVDDVATWHEDVRTYRIVDSTTTEAIAVFFLDLHPRKGKFTHAACWPLQHGQRLADGSYRTPYAAVLANFTKPTPTSPSLLRHDEVVTLFHEFGHVLHDTLTTVDIARFAGANTEWDFVEAPSQIMENWTWNADVLQRFAKHHKTGDPLPEDLVDGLIQLRDHNIALKLLRQCYYGRLDLDYHTSGPDPDLDAIDRSAHELTQLPFHDETFLAAGFGHLMGSYDAGYYGYLWAMVFGDDMFSVFAEEGVLSSAVGRRYREEVLSKGRSRDAMDHLRAFLGREPNADAFMRKIGLST